MCIYEKIKLYVYCLVFIKIIKILLSLLSLMEKKMVHYLKGVDKKDIGLCTEQIIASISLAY
jgi:hypothetical protein